ncbi:alpha/beta fold hydrolase [Novosphingobium flavum]
MDIDVSFVPGFDGEKLAVHRMGAGRPVILLHGLFSNAEINWIKYGTAQKVAEAGFDVIMPDLRAHGQSARPQTAAAYPHDVLVQDLKAVLADLAISDYDLCGFSLGARTALRGVTQAGLEPGKLILCGMGLGGLQRWKQRTDFFLDVIERYGTIPRDDPAYFAQNFMKSTKVDLVSSKLLLQSFAGARIDDFSDATMPTLLICGTEDDDNGSPEELAEVLPNARYAPIPGTHMSSVTMRQLAEEIVAFLDE